MRGIRTRFRAYHLGSAGSSFSYFADGHFTMIEARLTEDSREQVERERSAHGRGRFTLWTGDVGVALYARACAEGDARVPTMDFW